MIAECIRSEDRKARKPRLQILAAKFDQEIDMETMAGLKAAGWSKNDIDWIILDSLRAWRMVATMVRSSVIRAFGFRIRSSC